MSGSGTTARRMKASEVREAGREEVARDQDRPAKPPSSVAPVHRAREYQKAERRARRPALIRRRRAPPPPTPPRRRGRVLPAIARARRAPGAARAMRARPGRVAQQRHRRRREPGRVLGHQQVLARRGPRAPPAARGVATTGVPDGHRLEDLVLQARSRPASGRPPRSPPRAPGAIAGHGGRERHARAGAASARTARAGRAPTRRSSAAGTSARTRGQMSRASQPAASTFGK